MHRKKIEARLAKALKGHNICKVVMANEDEILRLIPLKISDELILAAREEECQVNGYVIRNKEDIEKVKIEESVLASISVKEIMADEAEIPDIDVEDWESVLNSLEEIGKIVIIYLKSNNSKHDQLGIGKIVKVTGKNVFLKYYGPEGLYDVSTWKIPFDEIESVVFGSRYSEVFAEYLPDSNLPDNDIKTLE